MLRATVARAGQEVLAQLADLAVREGMAEMAPASAAEAILEGPVQLDHLARGALLGPKVQAVETS